MRMYSCFGKCMGTIIINVFTYIFNEFAFVCDMWIIEMLVVCSWTEKEFSSHKNIFLRIGLLNFSFMFFACIHVYWQCQLVIFACEQE